MSTAPPSIPTVFPPFSGDGGSSPRLTVAEYHRLAEQGVLTDDGVELLEGRVVKKMPKNPRHVSVVDRLRHTLERILPPDLHLRLQDPVTLSTSEPEPDLAVVRGSKKEFEVRHPGPADVAIVVEVADTTLRWDRGFKKRLYAGAGLPVYWIVNLVNNQIEILTEPSGAAETPDYAGREVIDITSTLPVTIGQKHLGDLSAREILG